MVMGVLEPVTVSEFNGVHTGLRDMSRSVRQSLDTPRELINFITDESGHLWSPPAPSVLVHEYTGTSEEQVRVILNVTQPLTGIIVQVEEKLYFTATNTESTETPVLIVSDLGSSQPIWTVEFGDTLYVGNSDKTWKVTGATPTATDISESTVNGFHSAMYKGRRFVLVRNNDCYFSEINQVETFGDESFFPVGEGQSGGSHVESPGSVIRLVEFQDYLAIFCTQSIWMLSGSTPETFILRKTGSQVGCWARDSIVRIEEGVIFVGGTPRGEFGIYLFTGASSQNISQGISAYFRNWEREDWGTTAFVSSTNNWNAIRWGDYYILSANINTDLSMYIMDLKTRKWSTMGTWDRGPRLGLARNNPNPDSLLVSNGLDVYETREPILREFGESATFKVGWFDQDLPSGINRFVAVKLAVWVAGGSVATGPTVRLTANTPEGSATVVERTAQFDVYDVLVFPLNIRGAGIELEIEVIPDNDNQEILVEQLILVYSRKGPKVSRG